MRHIVRTLLLGGILFAALALAACAPASHTDLLQAVDNPLLASALDGGALFRWNDDPPFSVRTRIKLPRGSCHGTKYLRCPMTPLYITVAGTEAASKRPPSLFIAPPAFDWDLNEWKGTVTKEGELYKAFTLTRWIAVERNGTEGLEGTEYDVLVNPRRVIATPSELFCWEGGCL